MNRNGRNNHLTLSANHGDPQDTGDSQYDDAVEEALTGGN